jgi:hypothetical protein
VKVGDRITAITGSALEDCCSGTVTHFVPDLPREYVPIAWRIDDGAEWYTGHWLLRSEEGIAWIVGDDPARVAALRTAYALRKSTL